MKGLQPVIIENWCNCNWWSGPGPVLVFFRSYRLDLKTPAAPHSMTGSSADVAVQWWQCDGGSVTVPQQAAAPCHMQAAAQSWQRNGQQCTTAQHVAVQSQLHNRWWHGGSYMTSSL